MFAVLDLIWFPQGILTGDSAHAGFYLYDPPTSTSLLNDTISLLFCDWIHDSME